MEVEESLSISREGRVALAFLFSPPPLGEFPLWVSLPLMQKLSRSPSPVLAALMRRANSYHAAGCPAEFCESAAARDFMRLLQSNPTTHANDAIPIQTVHAAV